MNSMVELSGIKVGDLVAIVGNEKSWYSSGMDRYIGSIQRIKEVCLDIKGEHFKFEGDDAHNEINWWYWRSFHLTPYKRRKKVIKLVFK